MPSQNGSVELCAGGISRGSMKLLWHTHALIQNYILCTYILLYVYIYFLAIAVGRWVEEAVASTMRSH